MVAEMVACWVLVQVAVEVVIVVATIAGPRRIPRSPLLLHRIAVHSGLEALLQATAATLIAPRLVHGAASICCLARVMAVPPDGALEKAGTTIACVDAVVFS